MQRVKVYRLSADGQWADRGTGIVSVEWMEVSCRACASPYFGSMLCGSAQFSHFLSSTANGRQQGHFELPVMSLLVTSAIEHNWACCHRRGD